MESNQIKRGEGVMHSRVGSTTYLLEPSRGAYYELNATGSLVWETLATGPKPLAEIQRSMMEQFGIDAETSRSDLENFVRTMASKGMIEEGD